MTQVIDKPTNMREPYPPDRWHKSARPERAAPAAAQPQAAPVEPQPADPVASYDPAPVEPRPQTVYTIHVISPQGYPVTVQITGGTLDQLGRSIDKLMINGYMVPELSAPAGAQAQPAASTGATPVCPIHNRPMKPMQRPSKGCTHMCTAKVGESWCDQKA